MMYVVLFICDNNVVSQCRVLPQKGDVLDLMWCERVLYLVHEACIGKIMTS